MNYRIILILFLISFSTNILSAEDKGFYYITAHSGLKGYEMPLTNKTFAKLDDCSFDRIVKTTWSGREEQWKNQRN